MANKRLSLTRDQFASFLSDFEQIKQFEQLFSTTNANTISIDDVNISAGNAGEGANDALAQIIELSDTLNKEPMAANVSQLAVIETQLLALNLAPSASLGTVTSVAASGGTTGLTFAGSPITTSGTLTLGGTLGVANGGTGQTSYTNGQLLIGNTTGNTLTKATLIAGSGVSIANGAGSITISATGSGGTVTSVSVISANGFAGTVSTATTTPAITLSTSVTGLIKGNSTALSAAVAATDYVAPSAYASANGLTMATSRLLGRTTASTGAAQEISVAGGLTLSGGILTGTSGTVTSVGGTGTVNGITLTGTVTSSGNLTLGGTISGVSLTTQVSGTLPVGNGGTGATTITSGRLVKANGASAFSAALVYDTGTNSGIVSGNFIIDAGSLQTKANGSTALANALNDNLVITVGTGFMTFTGGGAAAQLGGMVAGSDGQRVVILNTTGGGIVIIGESGTSTVANRIWTPGLAPTTWNNLGTREFIYSAAQQRWLMIGSSSV